MSGKNLLHLMLWKERGQRDHQTETFNIETWHLSVSTFFTVTLKGSIKYEKFLFLLHGEFVLLDFYSILTLSSVYTLSVFGLNLLYVHDKLQSFLFIFVKTNYSLAKKFSTK